MISQELSKYLSAFMAGALVTYLATLAIRRVAPVMGLVDLPDARRVHKKTTPLGGGIAVFLGIHAGCAVIFLVPWPGFAGTLSFAWWRNYLAVSFLILCLGLLDDLHDVRPIVKLAGQIAVAVVAYSLGFHFNKLFGVNLPPAVDFPATTFWIVAIVNAFNLIDGMDGLAAGLAGIAAVGLAGLFVLEHRPGDTLVLLTVIGSCLAFLRFNFHPASIFLGDAGSMLLGLTLALIALSTGTKDTVATAIVVPFLAVGVPVFDTGLAIWRRASRRALAKFSHADPAAGAGRLFGADMDHTHHRLIRHGMSQRNAAIYMYAGATALVLVGLLAVVHESHALGIYLLAFTAATYVTVKHLANVELWTSGEAIVRGLERPSGKVMAVLAYPMADIAVMSVALLATIALLTEKASDPLRYAWLDHAPIWVGIPFVALALSKTYSRVWSRARISEFAGLGMALSAGYLVAGGIYAVIRETNARSLWLFIGFHLGVSLAFVAGLRAFPRLVQDTLAWLRRRSLESAEEVSNILVYGAGLRTTLFLREITFQLNETFNRYHVSGLIDPDPNLHQRLVHGYRVLGGLETLDSLIEQRNVVAVVLATPPDPASNRKLVDICMRHGVELLDWVTDTRRVVGIVTDKNTVTVTYRGMPVRATTRNKTSPPENAV